MGLDGEPARQPAAEFPTRPGLAQELQGALGSVVRVRVSGRNQC